ncbi:MAG: hypothetical protein AB1405_17030, partial [Bdellovibrionota bacterium]
GGGIEINCLKTQCKGDPTGLLIFLLFWGIAVIAALYFLAWNIWGREEIEITPHSVKLLRIIGNWARAKEYNVKHVKEFRASHWSTHFFNQEYSMALWGFGGGPLSFDYGAKTIRFGASIEEAEARVIVEAIRKRFPELTSSLK